MDFRSCGALVVQNDEWHFTKERRSEQIQAISKNSLEERRGERDAIVTFYRKGKIIKKANRFLSLFRDRILIKIKSG